MRKVIKCPTCRGTGAEWATCPHCAGEGDVECPCCGAVSECRVCEGTGKVMNFNEDCPTCKGEGYVLAIDDEFGYRVSTLQQPTLEVL